MMLSDYIARDKGLDAAYIERLARSASHRYREIRIPKRGGGKRTIYQPSRALKTLQRWIAANVIQDVPIHQAASAYVSGSSVKRHAEKHVRSNYLLRLDFRRFFPSIKGRDLTRHLVNNRPHLHFVEEDADIELLVAAVTRNGKLVIGAPSSPALSNQIMFQFDDLLHQWCARSNVTYTRYADDLYFSTLMPNVLGGAREKVVELLNSIDCPRLRLNDDKTVHTSRMRKRLVTGLSLSSDRKVSLGRRKKRKIRSMIHKHEGAGLKSEERSYLAGYLAYARSVEPEFIDSLVRKYKPATMRAVTGISQPRRSGHQ